MLYFFASYTFKVRYTLVFTKVGVVPLDAHINTSTEFLCFAGQ